jgi:hypothetical protein
MIPLHTPDFKFEIPMLPSAILHSCGDDGGSGNLAPSRLTSPDFRAFLLLRSGRWAPRLVLSPIPRPNVGPKKKNPQ